MVMREVVEGLQGGGAVGVVGDAKGAGAENVLEAVNGGLVVLVGRRLSIGSQEGEDGRNVRAAAHCKPVDGAD